LKDNNLEFFKIYHKKLNILCNLSLSELKIFFQLCRAMKYENGEVVITHSMRECFAAFLGVRKKTLYNIISSLVKKKVLIKSDGLYYINREIAQKGRGIYG